MKTTQLARFVATGAHILLLGCGEGSRTLNGYPDNLGFKGALLAPEGLLAGKPSTVYNQGGSIQPDGADPLLTACTTRFGPDKSDEAQAPMSYSGGVFEYPHPTARMVFLLSTRPFEQIEFDQAEGVPGIQAGDYWGVGPVVQTVPCGAPIQGVCFYGGHFDVPITLEPFPGCPAGVGPAPR